MASWLCIKCMHEFPDENVRKQPEYVGMALFCLVGAAAIAFGLACGWFYFTGDRDAAYLVKGGFAVVVGIGVFSMGIQFGRGVKAVCPSCGKPQGVPADSKIAAEVRANQARRK